MRGVHQAAAEPAGGEPQLCGGGREVLRVPGQQQQHELAKYSSEVVGDLLALEVETLSPETLCSCSSHPPPPPPRPIKELSPSLH